MHQVIMNRSMIGSLLLAGALLTVAPIDARAQTPAEPTHAEMPVDASRCAAPAPKASSLNFGHILSAARQSGMGQLLGGGGFGGGRGGMLAGMIANTALVAATTQQQPQRDPHAAAAVNTACSPARG